MELLFTEKRTNFELTVALDDLDGGGEGEYSSQQRAVALVFAVGIVVGLVINFINLHTDFQVHIWAIRWALGCVNLHPHDQRVLGGGIHAT